MRVRIKLDRLRELLAASRRSQNAWAVRIGLSRGHWSDIVNGKHPYPSAKTRMAMLDAFGLERDELFAIETTASSDASLARSLGERYVIDREVGEGAMGRVYRARDTRFGRPVAVKVVSDEALADLGPDRFLKEIRRSARLVHPHLLPVLDAGEADGTAFLVTPFVEGGSLRNRLEQEGSLPLERALSLASGIADALTHAHQRGVLHGDVKPENILLAGEHAYLTDFGLSRALHLEVVREWERPPEIDIAAGTPAYVSPEQARAEPEIDARSDVYSLACVLFEMLGGRAPYTGASTTEIVRRRFDAVPPDLGRLAPDLPAAVVRVIATAMALDPDRRPATPSELIERLRVAARIGAASPSSTTGRAVRALEALGGWAVSHTLRPRGSLVNSLVDDVRLTVRSLLKRPLFAIVAIVTLALGIGANAAVFSVIAAVVLRPLPFENPGELVRIYSTYEGRLCCTVSAPNFIDMREQATEMELAAYSSAAFSVTGGGDPERMSGYRVSAGFFGLLGIEPQIGRFPNREEELTGAPVLVISDPVWRERFGGDPGVLGQTLIVDGVESSIIGVTPEGFRVQGQPSLFAPLTLDPSVTTGRGGNFLFVLGRPVPGSSVESGMQELSRIYAGLVELYPDSITNRGVGARSLSEWLVGEEQERQLLVLWGAVGMVLLVACVNVINLMVARAEARGRELAVRAALGAGRWRLVRHFLTESIVISLSGGLLGILSGYLGVQALLGAFGGAVPRSAEVSLSPTVLAFTLGIALVTGVIVGLVPAIRMAFGSSVGALRDSGRTEAGGSSRLRGALVVLEIAAAFVLVAGAGVMLKSFWNLAQVDLGVDTSRLLHARVSLPTDRYQDAPAMRDFFERLRDETARLPGVEAVGLTNRAPFQPGLNYSVITPAGRPEIEAHFVEVRGAGPRYFETMGIEIVRGQAFTGREQPDSPPVVIINQELARQLFPGEDPVGSQITPGPNTTPWTIVGVVNDMRERGPASDPTPTFWGSTGQNIVPSMSIIVRATGDPLELVDDVRRITRELDPQLPVYQVQRLDERVSARLGDRRFAMTLLGIFGGIALALGAVGIYGVMAYAVERRTREIGLRQALGADRTAVLGLVAAQGARLIVIGVVLGTAGAYYLRESLGALLYEVGGFDVPIYSAVGVTLAAVALLACFVPARRAASVDPMEALRED